MPYLTRRAGLAAIGAALAAAALIGVSPAQAESNGGVRVMPLGDSITDGYNVPGGYRIGLWQKAVSAGYKVDFVGSGFNGPSSLGDHDHEGHSGWTISQIDANVNTWLRNTNPRTVLLHIGTNDMYGDTSGAPGRLGTLIDHITSAAPNADVFVATIITSSGRDTTIRNFNNAIPGLVQSRANAGKHVHLVNMYPALSGSDLADGIHPNSGGYQKMANVWFSALQAVPGSIGNGTPVTTPPTTTTTTTRPPTTTTTTPPTTTTTTTTPPTTTITTTSGGGPVTTTTTSATGGCTATYKLVNDWGSGFQGEVTVKNAGGGSISGWSVGMTFPSGVSVNNIWGGTPSASSGAVSVQNAAYNGTIAAGATTTFGFVLNGGSTPAPAVTSCSAG
jgi:lysophospholipase L1-like esterase